MSLKKILKIIKFHGNAILVFSGLSIYATFPVLFCIKRLFYGYSFDNLARLWSYWWLRFSWLNGLDSGHMTYLAYPYGVKSIPIFSLWSFYLKWSSIILGDVLTHNIQIILCFFLTALIMYFFIFYLTSSKYASIFAAILLSLSPYHFARSWDHLGLANMHWLVGYIFAIMYLHRSEKKRAAVLCGILFGLIGQFSNYYYVYFGFLFSVVYIFYWIWYEAFILKNRSREKWAVFLRNFFIAAFTAVLMLCMQLGPMFWGDKSGSHASGFMRGFSQMFADSATPFNYILPAVYHPLLGRFTEPWVGTIFYGENSGAEQSLYVGIVTIALAFLGWKKWRKKQKTAGNENFDDFCVGFFSFSLIVFLLTSFSPFWGSDQGFFIPFPSFFLFKIFPMFRNYARVASLVLICLGVLSAYGLKRLIEGRSRKMKKIITAGCCLVLCFEFLNFPPFHITDPSKYPEVYDWLKNQENSVLAEYPIDADIRRYMFYQRIHEKPVINGANPGTMAYEVSRKVLDLENPNTPGILKFLGATHIIVHKQMYLNGEGGAVLGKIPDINNKDLLLVKRLENEDVYYIDAEPLDPEKVEINEESKDTQSVYGPGNTAEIRGWKYSRDGGLKYQIRYLGLIPAIELRLTLENDEAKQSALIRADAHTIGLFDALVSMQAQARSVFDTAQLVPIEYFEEYRVGKETERSRHAEYDHQAGLMITDDRKVSIFAQTQDPLSMLFFLAHQEFFLNNEFSVFLNPGKTNYRMDCKVTAKEKIKAADGSIDCWKVEADFFRIKKEGRKIGRMIFWAASGPLHEIMRLKISGPFGVITLDKIKE